MPRILMTIAGSVALLIIAVAAYLALLSADDTRRDDGYRVLRLCLWSIGSGLSVLAYYLMQVHDV